jgi:putative endonuclease
MTTLGQRGEDIAVSHLERAGLAVVRRNFRTRHGEIDIVARDGEALVFVEVRVRRSRGYGGAAESITPSKRARLRLAASTYLARCVVAPQCRFDAVLIDEVDPPTVEWIQDAFD